MDTNKTNPFLNLPAAVILAGGLIAVAIIWTQKPAPANPAAGINAPSANAAAQVAQNAAQAPQASMAPVTAADHIFGNPNAPIKIVEYSDPSCPYCKVFFPTMRQIMQQYGSDGQVAWVYRSFPLSNIHPNAQHESQALECAAKLGGNTAFWAFANKLYDETPSVTPQTPQGLDQAKLSEFAKAAGIDVAKFNACLSSDETKALVDAQYADGVRAGVNGTPYSVIVTKTGRLVPISGAQPYATVKQTLDALLDDVAQ